MINAILPEGCPFVIGGGLVRDGILGGRPSDIDVWLPSNISVSDQEEFRRLITNGLTDAASIACVFSGPGALTAGPQNWAATPTARNVDVGENPYGDVNNHWVFEVNYDDLPSVNFMRSMTPWTNPQDFFNGLMRAFDIDQCMYFIGYMPGQQQVNQVIMPQHLAEKYVRVQDAGDYSTLAVETRRNLAVFRMNELYWNQYRLNLTSQARIEARMDKMCSKYNFQRRTLGELNMLGNILPVESIIATAIPLSIVMKSMGQGSNRVGLTPTPTGPNRVDPRPVGAPVHVTHNPMPLAQGAFNAVVEAMREQETRVAAGLPAFDWGTAMTAAMTPEIAY